MEGLVGALVVHTTNNCFLFDDAYKSQAQDMRKDYEDGKDPRRL